MNGLLFRYWNWRWRRHSAAAPITPAEARRRIELSLRYHEPLADVFPDGWGKKNTRLLGKALKAKMRLSEAR